jgi:predicted acyltransferase
MPDAPAVRLAALDVLRGAAVAGMLLVTMPGDWGYTFAQLRHADWNGWTATDMVFPAFLFSVGAALGLSFERATAGGAGRFRRKVARRAVTLILVGLALEATYNLTISLGARFPGEGGLAHLRFPGILQRIGLCYALAAAVLFITSKPASGGGRRARLAALGAAALTLLVGYALMLRFVPVPGYGSGRLDPVGSLPAWIDREVFTPAHLWVLATSGPGGPVTYDPEGLLSTLAATSNVLSGVIAAEVWRRRPADAVLWTALAGTALVIAGLLVSEVVPINKRLWTPSFALLSSGVSALVLAGAALALRFGWIARLATPLIVLGGNAILAFLLATVLSRLSGFAWIPEAGRVRTPQTWGDHLMLRVLPDPYLASLACAVGITSLITLALWPLHRRGLHLRL